MIPLRLRVRNFMCYRDAAPPLLLEGVHVACLCGENGAGKSALLDAVTWALWGQTSRGRDQDDLIAVGREEMEADLEFLAADTRYRVVRKRERGTARRPGHTILELQVSVSDTPALEGKGKGEGVFIPLTGAIRETQDKINAILRMDYQTFVNSAFLVQGRADEFTIKTPDKRKEVLGKVLGLDYYEELERKAREELRRCRDIAASQEPFILEAEHELGRRPEYEALVRGHEDRIAERRQRIEAAEQEAGRLRATKAGLEAKQGRLVEAQKRLRYLEDESARRRQSQKEAANVLAGMREVLARSGAITERFARLQAASQRKDKLDAAAAEFLRLSEEAARLDRGVQEAKAVLESDWGIARSHLQRLQAEAASQPQTEAQLAATQRELEGLGAAEERAAALHAALPPLGQEVGALQAANAALKEEMDAIKEKIGQLQRGEGTCPLCGTPLGEDGCRDVVVSYEAEGKKRAAAYRANAARLTALRDQFSRTQQEATSSDALVRSRLAPLRNREGALRAALHLAEEAAKQLPVIQTQMASLEAKLAARDFAPAGQAALERNREAARALGYDDKAHAEANRQAGLLRPAEAEHRQLEEAQRREPEEKKRLDALNADIALSEAVMAQERKAIEELTAETKALPQTAAALAAAERDARSLQLELDGLRQVLGAARADLQRLDAVQLSLAQKRRVQKAAQEDQGLYEDLARAFGRAGIQALIIESALPEIEAEANALLGRMTDNRMFVKLETQAALRTREGEKETLDIKVSDELGTRPYETFSGGEAFRVNVALRIALSRLLARRAGAPLPTLFIDEGFGTQDTSGRDKVVETITAIQDEFQRILVVTHIEELKEQFPVRIEVRKTPQGSTFAVV